MLFKKMHIALFNHKSQSNHNCKHKIIKTIWDNRGKYYQHATIISMLLLINWLNLNCYVLHETNELLSIKKRYITVAVMYILIFTITIISFVLSIVTVTIITIGIILASIVGNAIAVKNIIFTFQKQSLRGVLKYIFL